jgi:hypothetical protein
LAHDFVIWIIAKANKRNELIWHLGTTWDNHQLAGLAGELLGLDAIGSPWDLFQSPPGGSVKRPIGPSPHQEG